jgi:hypothetical protein
MPREPARLRARALSFCARGSESRHFDGTAQRQHSRQAASKQHEHTAARAHRSKRTQQQAHTAASAQQQAHSSTHSSTHSGTHSSTHARTHGRQGSSRMWSVTARQSQHARRQLREHRRSLQ